MSCEGFGMERRDRGEMVMRLQGARGRAIMSA